MDRFLSDVLKKFERQGWTLKRKTKPLALPPIIKKRYKKLPPLYLNFLEQVEELVNPSEQAGFLTEADFWGKSESAFKWNEWELMSLDAAKGYPDIKRDVKKFWSTHIPILNSVGGGYQHLSLDLNPKTYGKIVNGSEPDFEGCIPIFRSFKECLEKCSSGRKDRLLKTIL